MRWDTLILEGVTPFGTSKYVCACDSSSIWLTHGPGCIIITAHPYTSFTILGPSCSLSHRIPSLVNYRLTKHSTAGRRSVLRWLTEACVGGGRWVVLSQPCGSTDRWAVACQRTRRCCWRWGRGTTASSPAPTERPGSVPAEHAALQLARTALSVDRRPASNGPRWTRL